MERLEHPAVARERSKYKEGFLAALGMTSEWSDRRRRSTDRALPYRISIDPYTNHVIPSVARNLSCSCIGRRSTGRALLYRISIDPYTNHVIPSVARNLSSAFRSGNLSPSAKSNRLKDLLPLVPACLARIQSIQPGQIVTIED